MTEKFIFSCNFTFCIQKLKALDKSRAFKGGSFLGTNDGGTSKMNHNQ